MRRPREPKHKEPQKLTIHLLHRLIGDIMETIATLNAKVAQLDSDVQEIKNKPAPAPPVATQDDLDVLGAGLDRVSADLAPLK